MKGALKAISQKAKNLFNKTEYEEKLKRLQQYKKRTNIKHFPAIAKFKSICGKLNGYQSRFVFFLKRRKIAFLSRFVKKNLARVGVLGCAVFVSFANLNARSSNLLEGNFLFNKDNSLPLNENTIKKSNSLSLAPISDAQELSDYEKFLKEEGEKNTVLGAIQPKANPTIEEFNKGDQDVFIYKVKEGDTISSIAKQYSITTSTIIWANDLTTDSVIKPGDEIFILPVTGIKYKVKDGDSVKSLAKKYKTETDKIVEFNDLDANGDLTVGEEIIIPDGQIDDQPRYQDTLAKRYTTVNPNAQLPQETPAASSSNLKNFPAHRFPYGWCTWYVATKRHVPWGGNAGTWLYHAKAYGARTGRKPVVGAIMVTNESRWGHVAYVEKVNGNTITVSEMNYKGFGIKSTRTLDINSSVIKGFIY